MSLRYCIAHPDGRLLAGRLSDYSQETPYRWTTIPARALWFQQRPNAARLLGQLQQAEPEARLVEQETEDL